MLKAIIVDDETTARSELRCQLEQVGHVKIEAEAENVREAIGQLKKYPCDVIFLDINMPDASGLKLAAALRNITNPPQIVFVTAQSEHAVKAFDIGATDYIIKPVEPERLKLALTRVRELISLKAQSRQAEYLIVEKGLKKIFLPISEIRYAIAHDDYAYLQTETERFFSADNITVLEKKLEGYGFFRTHRGYLVNLSLIEEVESMPNNGLKLGMHGIEERIPVSRRRVPVLRKILDL